jgi:predicted nucleic acid-binding protein
LSAVFFDTNLFIYLFEDDGALGQEAVRLVQRMGERGDKLLTSTLTIGEILVKPRMTDAALAKRYEAYFRSPEVQVLSFDIHAANRYADIAQSGPRTPSNSPVLPPPVATCSSRTT